MNSKSNVQLPYRTNIWQYRGSTPHPDQVSIDMNAGTAHVQGPMTRKVVQQLEHWTERRDSWAAELQDIEEHLETETEPDICKLLKEEKAQADDESITPG